MTDTVEIMDILKEAINCDEIIIESEDADGNTEETVEEYEIIDIIEEIEEEDEIEEDVNTGEKVVEPFEMNRQRGNVKVESSKINEKVTENVENVENVEYEELEDHQNRNSNGESQNAKSTLQYNVSDDWEDEESEQLERLDSESEIVLTQKGISSSKKYNTSKTKRTFNETQSNNVKNVGESHAKKSRMNASYEDQQDMSNDGNELIRTDDNLVYTVLESKKHQSNHAVIVEAENDHRIDQLEEDSMPVEGAIYYDNENANTLYVTQAVEDGEQYQFNDVISAEHEQEWDNSQQSMEQPQDEDSEQGQIFLQEDEDGHLYFKDENGTLQPVYLTEDGNYAIAGNSSGDELDNQEHQLEETQLAKSSVQDDFIVPDKQVMSNMSGKQTAIVPLSNMQDVDNEDNTVTISLIISEDEHGQKRTQVIIPTTENLKCDICHKTFKTSFQLLKHNRLKHAKEEDITTRNFPCDLCPKRFTDQNSLARHRKLHTGDRPFQCLECQKTFPTATALRRHLTLHNPQSRPLPCIYCGRRFQEKAHLVKHEQSHLAAEQRNYTCDICRKTFTQANELALHKKNHDPDRKFDCEVCGREFNRLNNLQRHMMVHQQQGANEEILSCEVCGITYKFMSSLTRHMVTTHMNPEKMRQQAEEQRRKRENNYRRYLENRKMYETQNSGTYVKRNYQRSMHMDDNEDEV